jgi:hypothetical protein
MRSAPSAFVSVTRRTRDAKAPVAAYGEGTGKERRALRTSARAYVIDVSVRRSTTGKR